MSSILYTHLYNHLYTHHIGTGNTHGKYCTEHDHSSLAGVVHTCVQQVPELPSGLRTGSSGFHDAPYPVQPGLGGVFLPLHDGNGGKQVNP